MHRRTHIEIDILFDVLFPQSARGRDDRMCAYDRAHLLARMFVDRGETAVLECTYARHDQRASLVDALVGSFSPLWVIEFFVTPDEAVGRSRGRSQATDLDDEMVRERAEAFPYSDEAFRVVSSTTDPEDHASAIAAWLKQDPRPVDQESWVQVGRDWK